MADPASISDILASVARAHADPTVPDPADETHEAQRDLQQLTRAWTNERVAPELLEWPGELMERVMRRLRRQITSIETSTSSMNSGLNFTLIVQQTELERFKFLIRSFLRTRIAKIDAHPQHYLSRPLLLSAQEHTYLTTHNSLLHRHFTSSFLGAFPEKLRRLDDKTGTSMVGGPDVDKAVVVRCIGFPSTNKTKGVRRGKESQFTGFEEDSDEDMGDPEEEHEGEEVEVSCGFTPLRSGAGGEGDEEGGRETGGREKTIRMRRGEIWVVRWSGVKEAVERGWVELV